MSRQDRNKIGNTPRRRRGPTRRRQNSKFNIWPLPWPNLEFMIWWDTTRRGPARRSARVGRQGGSPGRAACNPLRKKETDNVARMDRKGGSLATRPGTNRRTDKQTDRQTERRGFPTSPLSHHTQGIEIGRSAILALIKYDV